MANYTNFNAVAWNQTWLNGGNSLTKGLICCVVANEGNIVDLIKNRTPNTNPNMGTRKSGRVINSGGFSNSAAADCNFTAGPFSIATFQYTDVLNASYNSIMGMSLYTNETTNTGWNLLVTASTDGSPNHYNYQSFNNNGGALYSLVSNNVAIVGDSCIVCTNDATTRRMFVNGAADATTTNSLTMASTSAALNFGTSGAQNIYWAAIWKRALSIGEATFLSGNPWAMFKQPRLNKVNMIAGGTPTFAGNKQSFTTFFQY